MNKVNKERLHASFPKLFQSRINIECRDGWFDLVNQLCVDISKECEQLGLSVADWPNAVQIKEKFGCLRFYTSNSTDSVDDLKYIAMNDSMTICEVCGAPGRHYKEDCYRTLCDSCEVEYERELKERWS